MSLYDQEIELLLLAKQLGLQKTRDLLKIIRDKKIPVDNLLAYLKSIDKVPSPVETKIQELEKRISTLEEKIGIKGPSLPQPSLKEWSYNELREYLDRCKKYHKLTFLYYKALTFTNGKISREDLIKKLGELAGKEIRGLGIAGVQGGITMSVTKHGYERLDWKSHDSREFSINEKYRDMLRKYFESGG